MAVIDFVRPWVVESSAANTRGLIEALVLRGRGGRAASLPRRIPAASLKPHQDAEVVVDDRESSAANTRGLIEAVHNSLHGTRWRRLPRRIPAASLKQSKSQSFFRKLFGLPRRIPAASLKPVDGEVGLQGS